MGFVFFLKHFNGKGNGNGSMVGGVLVSDKTKSGVFFLLWMMAFGILFLEKPRKSTTIKNSGG